jgi:UDP-3-O-[3-hydroxymyristoyl] glucosamine N-acyltransferase
MSYTAEEIARHINGKLVGDAKTEVNGVASIRSATARSIVFVEDEKLLADALGSAAAVIIAGDFAEQSQHGKTIIISDQPKLAFARAAAFMHHPAAQQLGVHPTAFVHQNAKLGLGVSVGPNTNIQNAATIGGRTRIGAGVSIGAGVVLGDDCVLEANVVVYPGTRIGKRVTVHAGAVLGSDGFGYVRVNATGRYEKFPQMGTLEIEDDVEIGANATIDRGALDATVIGSGSKLDNMVHIGHNVQVGKNVIIAAQTGISGSAVIADNVVIAGQVGIADHVTIEEGAILGAQSGVPTGKTIRGNGILFWGTPARPIAQYLKELALLSRMAKKK